MNDQVKSMTRVLIIDDDEKLSALLTEFLGGFGMAVKSAAHPQLGLQMLQNEPPDLVILDVMLPGMDGFTVCRKVRESSALPIIMLTARGDLTDRVVGLEIGADDYLAKPFEPRELVARIQAVLRRGEHRLERESLQVGGLVMNWSTRTAVLDGAELDLTTAEFDLLGLFAKAPGRVLSRDHIMSQTKGVNWATFDRSVDVLISRLRLKLGDNPRQPTFIRTVRGIGYSFIGRRDD